MRVFCQQTALFVIPSMVLLGWVLDKPLALLFDPFESVVLYISGQFLQPILDSLLLQSYH